MMCSCRLALLEAWHPRQIFLLLPTLIHCNTHISCVLISIQYTLLAIAQVEASAALDLPLLYCTGDGSVLALMDLGQIFCTVQYRNSLAVGGSQTMLPGT